MSTPLKPLKPEATIRKVGVVGVLVRENQLLAIERSQRVRAPGRHCFPGGAIERGETEAEALIREMQEELGVAVRPVRRLHRSVTPWGVDLRWWLSEFECDAPFCLAPEEVAAANWYYVPELLRLPTLLESNHHFLAAWQRGDFDIDGLCRE
jgi:8-oxo-dGTP diphosphatase